MVYKEFQISFEINYKTKYNNENKTFEKTGEVEYYELNLKTVNLNGTKLTPEIGY